MGCGSELLLASSSSIVGKASWLAGRIGLGGIGGVMFVVGGRFGGAFASSHASVFGAGWLSGGGNVGGGALYGSLGGGALWGCCGVLTEPSVGAGGGPTWTPAPGGGLGVWKREMPVAEPAVGTG